MKYKISLELIVEMSEDTKVFYDENPPDLHEALMTSEKAKLKCEVCNINEVAQEDWS